MSAVVLLMNVLLGLTVFAQVPVDEPATIVNGYGQKVFGQDFAYHSSIQIAKESLLIRATDGNSSMEWETAPVPARLNTEYVTFVWLAGIGSSPGYATFDVAINGQTQFTFAADAADG